MVVVIVDTSIILTLCLISDQKLRNMTLYSTLNLHEMIINRYLENVKFVLIQLVGE